jgi:hypothetical protein
MFAGVLGMICSWGKIRGLSFLGRGDTLRGCL